MSKKKINNILKKFSEKKRKGEGSHSGKTCFVKKNKTTIVTYVTSYDRRKNKGIKCREWLWAYSRRVCKHSKMKKSFSITWIDDDLSTDDDEELLCNHTTFIVKVQI